MDNNTVAHEWAHGRKAKGSNFFTDSGCLYSYGYHYMVGARIEGKKETYYLMNSNGSSPSTERQKSHARNAVTGSTTFYVNDPSSISTAIGRKESDPNCKMTAALLKNELKREYKERLKDAQEAYEDSLSRRSGSNVQEWGLVRANSLVGEANHLAKFFKLGYRMKPDYELNEADMLLIKEREKRHKAAQKAAFDKAERVEREHLKKWLAGEDIIPARRTSRPYLRVIMQEGRRMLESTWGIKNIPYDVVKAVIPWAQASKDDGLPMLHQDKNDVDSAMQVYASEQGVKFDWRLTSIDEKGTIRFGCHFIPLKMAKAIQTVAEGLLHTEVS